MKRTRNFVTNCDWKKCFSIRKFEWKFTSTAFTQEIESRIDFGLLKRVNGTPSHIVWQFRIMAMELSVWQVRYYISKCFVDKVLGCLYD